MNSKTKPKFFNFNTGLNQYWNDETTNKMSFRFERKANNIKLIA